MTDAPKANGDEDVKAFRRLASNPFLVLVVAGLLPLGGVGFGTREVTSKLDAIAATVNDLKLAVAGLQAANLDARTRENERAIDRLEASSVRTEERLKALEARPR